MGAPRSTLGAPGTLGATVGALGAAGGAMGAPRSTLGAPGTLGATVGALGAAGGAMGAPDCTVGASGTLGATVGAGGGHHLPHNFQQPPYNFMVPPPPQGFMTQQGYIQPQVYYPNQWSYVPMSEHKSSTLKLQLPKLRDRASTEDFYLFKDMFESMMRNNRTHPNDKVLYLIQAIDNKDLQKAIMKFQNQPQGYLLAMETLVTRFGNQTSLKQNKMAEIKNFNYNTKTSEGLFKLSELISGILADSVYNAELHSGSILYMETFSKLTSDTQEKYMEKYLADSRNLKTLGAYLKHLAVNKKEQEV